MAVCIIGESPRLGWPGPGHRPAAAACQCTQACHRGPRSWQRPCSVPASCAQCCGKQSMSSIRNATRDQSRSKTNGGVPALPWHWQPGAGGGAPADGSAVRRYSQPEHGHGDRESRSDGHMPGAGSAAAIQVLKLRPELLMPGSPRLARPGAGSPSSSLRMGPAGGSQPRRDRFTGLQAAAARAAPEKLRCRL